MTKKQCYSYGIKAITNLTENDIPITPDTFYTELFYLWREFTEEGIEKHVKKLEDKQLLM